MKYGYPIRLTALLLTAGLALAPAAALAELHKCTVNGQTTYSSEPCGKGEQKVDGVVNVAPATTTTGAPAAGASGGGSTGVSSSGHSSLTSASAQTSALSSGVTTGNPTADAWLAKIGITDKESLTTALLILIPLTFAIIFFLTRKSEVR